MNMNVARGEKDVEIYLKLSMYISNNIDEKEKIEHGAPEMSYNL